MHITTITLNPHHPNVLAERRDLCVAHSRILDATIAMAECPHRVLWATPHPNVLTIRASEPVTTARLPRDYAARISHRPWQIPDHTGKWIMAGVFNPAKTPHRGGPTLNQPDRKRITLQPTLFTNPNEQAAWLDARLEGATLLRYKATRAEVVRGTHRTNRTITVRRVHARALWEVSDPDAMAPRLNAGIGMDKTWGCGLTLWQPCD